MKRTTARAGRTGGAVMGYAFVLFFLVFYLVFKGSKGRFIKALLLTMAIYLAAVVCSALGIVPLFG